jgi:CBS domain-containing protein
MMDWQKLRYVLVEDGRGKLTGLVSSGLLLRHFRNKDKGNAKATNVKDIMVTNPKYIGPDASIKKAMEMMKSNRIGCLPVIKNDKLVGVITEKNFRRIAATLLSILINKEKDI